MTALLDTPLRSAPARLAGPVGVPGRLRLAEPAAMPDSGMSGVARRAPVLVPLDPILPLVRAAGGIPAGLRPQRSLLLFPTAAPWPEHRLAPVPLRFTRRARLLGLLLIAGGLFAVLTLAITQATPDGGGLADAPSSVVVQPGDTLWQIATEIAPGDDPVVVIERIRAANALGTAGVRPGQLLSIPRG